MMIPDEQEVRKFESLAKAGVTPEMLTTELCSRSTVPKMYKLLAKKDKTIDDYQILVLKDS